MSSSSTTYPEEKWKSSSPPVSPAKGRRVRDKLETSPTSRAKCQHCQQTIIKGTPRVGIQGKVLLKPQGVEVWRLKYYHDGCVTDETKRSLFLESAASKKKAAKNKAKKSHKKDEKLDADKKPAAKSTTTTMKRTRHILKPAIRKQMEQDLRQLRKCFAELQGCDECRIFQYRSLQEIIKNMPRNTMELMKCWGIKGKRCDQYGESILCIVNSYLDRYEHPQSEGQSSRVAKRQRTRANRTVASASAAAVAAAGGESDNDDDDDDHDDDSDIEEIETGPTLSVHEIVRRRVQAAEARGEVLEIL